MKTKAKRKRTMHLGIITLAMIFGSWNIFAMGRDYPNDSQVNIPSWPEGMKNLVNRTNRVGGFMVNAQDIFFFSGTASDFNAFLGDYAKIQPIEKHLLILHDGVGETVSLRREKRGICDWKLDGCSGQR